MAPITPILDWRERSGVRRSGGGGGIEGSVSTQAYATAEARDIFAAAGKILGSYKPMGASLRRERPANRLVA
jgi:hypothetical protein